MNFIISIINKSKGLINNDDDYIALFIDIDNESFLEHSNNLRKKSYK